ncbi:MAG: transglutaminase family protein [Bacteroidota bacterium]
MKTLAESYFYDCSHPSIQQFVERWTKPGDTPRQKAIDLYTAVRDGWRYNPYLIRFRKEDWQASRIMERPEGHCLDKAIIYLTCLRAVGIPARIHLAKVRNHIAVEKMTKLLGTDVLTPHGMVDVQLDGQWLKTSPAFNRSLCEKLNVATLDFDGQSDSIFQEFDREGGQFMEYLEDYGAFDEFPLEFIIDNFKTHYTRLTPDHFTDGLLEIK